ncbi:MAG: hypothetical protein HY544_01180 [Candidatus Diapherotrites archaeon]|uniref:Uncharacterized protein n=1 Tax=Candidatus Iainarchaeum sp. TaxID=3101447 RepID=A0A8T3YHT9_9ARCH|nr:hypothetical protein [Candidatus Diapherotrites archaeon]
MPKKFIARQEIGKKILMSLERPELPQDEISRLKKEHAEFVREKARILIGLRSWISRKQKTLEGGGVTAEVANAVYALNDLPFLCTRDSGNTRIFLGRFLGQEIGINEAQKHEEVFINPANITVQVDPSSHESNRFLRSLFLWQVKNFPDAEVLPISHFGLPTALAITAELLPSNRVSPKKAIEIIRRSNRFLNGLTTFVKEYNSQK